jgi:D-aminopeptidase
MTQENVGANRPGDETKKASITDQLDALFEVFDRSDAPGLVVGVAQFGRTIYRRAYGMASLESRVTNTPATRMRIGSTSKHFACLLLLLLAEDGKLDLDQPIRNYVTELDGPGGDPTLRQLMRHRGGSRCYVDLGFLTSGLKPRPPGFALETQRRQRGRNFEPGAAMIYNNGGYHLLSIAAERVTGVPFETLLADRLFAPLGMQATASVPSDYVITPGIATMHTPLPDGGWRRGLFPSEEVKGEGAIVSTVDDMLRWAGHLSQQSCFGSPDSWKQLLTPHSGADPKLGAYALGLRLVHYRGLRTIGHTGGVVGGSCDMLCLPDQQLEVVILVNGAPGVTPDLTRKVVDILLADQLGPPELGPPTSAYRSWLGGWWSPDTGLVYSLVDDQGELKLRICMQPYEMDLMVTSGGEVILPEASIGEITFGFHHPADPDVLKIGFGAEVHDYVRLRPEEVHQAKFAHDVEGRYVSADADATALITRTGETLTITIRDGFGEAIGAVHPLGPDVAAVGPLNGLYSCVVSLMRSSGQVRGFHLNAPRTRDLEFVRV